MSVVISTSARNDACDAVVDLVDTGSSGTYNFGQIKLYTANFATLLAEIPFAEPVTTNAFGNATAGVATANGVPLQDTSANAGGVCEAFTFVNTDDNSVLSGTVSASGGDITLNDTTIAIGDTVSITGLTVTMPTGSLNP